MQWQTFSTQTVTYQATESDNKRQYLEGDRQTVSQLITSLKFKEDRTDPAVKDSKD